MTRFDVMFENAEKTGMFKKVTLAVTMRDPTTEWEHYLESKVTFDLHKDAASALKHIFVLALPYEGSEFKVVIKGGDIG